MKRVFALMTMTILAASCGQKQAQVPALDPANIDSTVTPGQDFYRYSVGGWQKNHPLAPEYARFGSFDQLRENNVERINELFAEMAKNSYPAGSEEQKISDLYKMGLDSVSLNMDGAKPIEPTLAAIAAIADKEQLAEFVAQAHGVGEDIFFSCGVEADLANSDNQVLYLSQGGLGIGDRDYYTDPKFAEIKAGYRNYLAKIFELAGVDEPQKAADNALAVEDALAEKSWTSRQNRDYAALYNPMSTVEFEAKYPGFDFVKYFEVRGIPSQEMQVVMQPSYFEGMAEYVAEADLSVLKDYVAAHVISGASQALSDEFGDANFEFYSRQMSGIQEQKPRWKRAMSVPDHVLGEAVGKMYVQKYFPESSKEKMVKLVKNLQEALGEHIDNLDWMGDTTKAKAREKLSAFTVKIGYPDKWKDYSSLVIDPQKSYYENLKAASKWYVDDNMSKLGKPTDRTEWGMTPQTVNAYYNPTTNEICFPAAILQPPFFNPDADDAVNYGGIGVVIGHEMSHGFDDQGRLFDASGNMVDWWTEDDDARFRAKAEKLAAQFDKVEIAPGIMADGHVTMGENIGDHGGLSIAYTAMENALKGKGKEPIDGLTPAQRFYLSYGTIWAQNITDEEKVRLTKLDVHSLAENRVNVSIKNFQTFYDAFGIKEGDPMYIPESERVHIW